MNPVQAIKAMETVDVKFGKFHIKPVEPFMLDATSLDVEIAMECTHRETGEPLKIGATFPIRIDGDEEFVLGQVCGACVNIASHEVQESFMVNGERMFDPHVKSQRRF